MKALLLVALLLGACAAPLPPEPIVPTKITLHPPTPLVPYAWTDEAIKPGWHDTLYHEGRVIPGIPASVSLEDAPRVLLH